ncbi:hypothetical protein [Winogradskyella poriferorum]|uniref:hypothetical protein n=1 Tax=Winogradskyella poriferorum TaxID=307627 RepID=UPI003D6463A1
MNEFDKYYNGMFRQDIQTFFSKIPERSKHTFDDRKIFTVQYQTLTKDFDCLDFLDKEMKAFFGTALFFTVLVDQVCYSHYQDYYNKFQKLTRYPKFVGNSPSTDRTNFPPIDIFSAFNYSRDKEKMFNTENVEFWAVFNKAKPVMKKDTINFFKTHMNEIDGEEFWKKCEQELPYHP